MQVTSSSAAGGPKATAQQQKLRHPALTADANLALSLGDNSLLATFDAIFQQLKANQPKPSPAEASTAKPSSKGDRAVEAAESSSNQPQQDRTTTDEKSDSAAASATEIIDQLTLDAASDQPTPTDDQGDAPAVDSEVLEPTADDAQPTAAQISVAASDTVVQSQTAQDSVAETSAQPLGEETVTLSTSSHRRYTNENPTGAESPQTAPASAQLAAANSGDGSEAGTPDGDEQLAAEATPGEVAPADAAEATRSETPRVERRRYSSDAEGPAEPIQPPRPGENSAGPNSATGRVSIAGMQNVDATPLDSSLPTTPEHSPAHLSNPSEGRPITAVAAQSVVQPSTNANRASKASPSGSSVSRSTNVVDNLTASTPAQPAAGGPTKKAQATTPNANLDRIRLVQRVARSFQRIGPQGGQINMMLHPEELGSVRLNLKVNDRKLDATITTQSTAAMELLREHLPELRQRLSDFGMEIDRVEFEVASESEAQPDSSQNWQQGNQSFQDQFQDRQQTQAARAIAGTRSSVKRPAPIEAPAPLRQPTSLPTGIDLRF